MVGWGVSDIRRNLVSRFVEPAAGLIAGLGISPNALTWLGFVANLVVAWLLWGGHLFLGGFLVLAAGAFDLLDGAVARRAGKSSTFGALLDSTLDRLSEAALFFGLLAFFVEKGRVQEALLVFAALVGSMTVSYVRARAEGLGLDCKVGWVTRPERVIILALGLMLSPRPYALLVALWILAVFSNITAWHRVLHVWQKTRKQRSI